MPSPNVRASLITLLAPAAWGSTYITAGQLLPADHPLYAALLRALPAGLILLAIRRRLPQGIWWGRAAVLGVLNFAAFFPLLFLAAFHLPGGVASTIQAGSPIVVMALAFILIGEKAGWVRIAASLVGLVGVAFLVLQGGSEVDAVGVLAAIGSVIASGLGFVLIKRWPAPVDMITLISWQLVAGGLVLLPLTVVIEGGPPALDAGAVAGYLWIGSVGTVVAYLCWFHGLTRLPAGTVSLLGLTNPVVATALGVTIAGEQFGLTTAVGMALVLGGVLAGQPAIAKALQRRAAKPCCVEDLPTCCGMPSEGVNTSPEVPAKPSAATPHSAEAAAYAPGNEPTTAGAHR